MRQKEIFKKIGTIIQELSDHYDYLKQAEGHLNDIELELFAANAHFLTDHIEILSKFNLQNRNITSVVENNDPKTSKIFFEPVVQQIKHDVEPKEEKRIEPPPVGEPEKLFLKDEEDEPLVNEDKFLPNVTIKQDETFDAYPEKEQVNVNLKSEDTANDVLINGTGYKNTGYEAFRKAEVIINDEPYTLRKEVTQPESETVQKTEETPFAGTTQSPVHDGGLVTVNQKILSQLAQKPQVETEKVTGPPISDLKQGITLNDKLLYVRDLFNGYNLAYSEAIEILNRFTRFEEALRFLKTNYVVKNQWESKPGTMDKFYALLKRRYGN